MFSLWCIDWVGRESSAFRTFVRFVLVWFCWFPLPLGFWEGLRFVIVAFPGLFSYPFLWLWYSLDFSLVFFFYSCMHVVNPIMFDNFASLFNCMTVDQSSDEMTAPSSICFKCSAPVYQCLWSGSSWSCLWVSYVLASDRHWAIFSQHSKFCLRVYRIYNLQKYDLDMLTSHSFVIWSCIRLKGEFSCD